MTTDQAEFVEQVEHFCEGLHIASGACPGCSDCGLEDEADVEEIQAQEEGGFSWSACDSCGSTLGGNRYPSHGTYRGEEGELRIIHLDVCVDCVMYHEYGTLPEEVAI